MTSCQLAVTLFPGHFLNKTITGKISPYIYCCEHNLCSSSYIWPLLAAAHSDFLFPSGWNLWQQKLTIWKFCFQEVFAINSPRSLHLILIAVENQCCCIYWLYCDVLYLVWDCMKLFPVMDVFMFYVVSKTCCRLLARSSFYVRAGSTLTRLHELTLYM